MGARWAALGNHGRRDVQEKALGSELKKERGRGAVKVSSQLKWGIERQREAVSRPELHWERFQGLGIVPWVPPYQTRRLTLGATVCNYGRKNAAMQQRATWGLEVVTWQSHRGKELIRLQEADKAGEVWRSEWATRAMVMTS